MLKISFSQMKKLLRNKVSVIIPYNRDRGYLDQAVMSARLQSYPDVEVILSQDEKWCAYNINRGLEKAGGEYFKVLAEDDLLTPDCLSILVAGIQRYDFVYADGENFGNLFGWPARSYDTTVTLESMLVGNGINGGAVLYRTQMLRDVGGWDETLWTAEEYDLHLRLIKAGYRHRHIEGIVYRYRRHSGNKSDNGTSFNRIARRAIINMIKQKYV